MEEEDVSASGGKGEDSWQGEGRSVVIAGERKEGMEGELAWGPPPGRGWATSCGSRAWGEVCGLVPRGG